MSDNIDKTSNPSLKTSEKPRLDLSTVLSELETNQAVGNDKITGNDKSIFSDFKDVNGNFATLSSELVQTDLEIEKNTGFPPEPGKVSSSTNQDVGQINKNKVGPITILRRPEASKAPTISGSFKHFQSHVAAGFASLSFEDDDKKEDLSDEDSDDEEEEEDSDGWDFKCVGLDHDPACPDEGISRKY